MQTDPGLSIIITTDWEFDADFIGLLDNEIRRNDYTPVIVSADHLEGILHEFEQSGIKAAALIDRASDTSSDFIKLQHLLKGRGSVIVDPIEQIRWTRDKATLHLEFHAAGIPTPYTLILAPYQEVRNPVLHLDELARLGRPFVIKPANTTGGGIGVVQGAESFQEILKTRTEFQSDKYLIQEQIAPREEGGFRYWFRSFYVGGQIFTAWWHNDTHYYTALDDRWSFPVITQLMQRIAAIARLTFFSSEIVQCADGRWVVVDYVNESCDMRLQSGQSDGVPDDLVQKIAEALVAATLLQIQTANTCYSP